MKKIVLRAGKEKAIKNRHHWIFSGAIKQAPNYIDGDILKVYDEDDKLLGSAYFNSRAKINGRMVAFGAMPPLEALTLSLSNAIELRRRFFDTTKTNAVRLVNGEGDCLPGLIVDQYNDCLVLQISTLGMEKLKSFVVKELIDQLHPRMILEKSNLPTRKEEGLSDHQEILFGSHVENIEVLENTLRFVVSPASGQKTGFFLDHREMRRLIRQHADGKKVLNAFSYTGGFTIAALAGGAALVDSVDISKQAIDAARINTQLNGFDPDNHGFFSEDVFLFLRNRPLDYDIVILDPPAFAKRKKDIISACRGYKDINRLALKKMPARSLLLTCSCSYHVDEQLFKKVVFQAAVEANRSVRIIGKHLLAFDHPLNICHPEGDYLKSLLLYVE